MRTPGSKSNKKGKQLSFDFERKNIDSNKLVSKKISNSKRNVSFLKDFKSQEKLNKQYERYSNFFNKSFKENSIRKISTLPKYHLPEMLTNFRLNYKKINQLIKKEKDISKQQSYKGFQKIIEQKAKKLKKLNENLNKLLDNISLRNKKVNKKELVKRFKKENIELKKDLKIYYKTKPLSSQDRTELKEYINERVKNITKNERYIKNPKEYKKDITKEINELKNKILKDLPDVFSFYEVFIKSNK